MKNTKILLALLSMAIICLSITACTKEDPAPEPEPEVEEPTVENMADTGDLLNTLDWQDNEEMILLFKDEVVSGYDISIGTALYDTEENKTETEEAEEPEEESAETESPYNILQWKYAEYEETGYLLLEYNYADDNYKVVFYKDSHDNVNVAELYINLNKQEKDSIKEWSDSVFIIEEPEPDVEEVPEVEEEPEPEPTTTEQKEESSSSSKLAYQGIWDGDDGNHLDINSEGYVMQTDINGSLIDAGYIDLTKKDNQFYNGAPKMVWNGNDTLTYNGYTYYKR